MSGARRSGRRVQPWYWLAAVLIAAGTVMCVAGLRLVDLDAAGPPPQPPSSDLVGRTPGNATPTPVRALAPSVPVRIKIPAIKVDAPVIPLGLEKDGSLGVPPLSRVDEVAWYKDGPTPGENGRSVLVGHVDSKSEPGVFYKLGKLRPGRQVQIKRKDGTVPAFRVDRVRRVGKDEFPTGSVYGRQGAPELRLITCGGKFDRKRGHYVDNIVIYASLIPGSQNS